MWLRGADTYRVTVTDDPALSSGHDVIVDAGDRGNWLYHDVLEIAGLYGPSSGDAAEAFARLSFARVGDDMIVTFPGMEDSVTVSRMFDAPKHGKFFVEELRLNAGYWEEYRFMFRDAATDDISDDRSIFLTYGADFNEIIFGSDQGEQIFGGTGTNFIWTGDGADTLVYKVGDGEGWPNTGGKISRDIVMDFDPARDVLDFREVTGELGAAPSLQFSSDAEGDAKIFIDTGNWEVADIDIELRGVTQAEAEAATFLF